MRRTVTLTVPEFFFVVGTRAMLASGVAFLLAKKLRDRERKIVGTALLVAGAITTVPAAMAVITALKERQPVVPDEVPEPENREFA